MVRTVLSLTLLLASPALAGGGYDTNHPDVRWHTYETDHFVFHWPESRRDKDDPHYFTTEFSVGRLAKIAEESHPKVCEQFDYCPEEKTHVVLYDQDTGWEGNGFAMAELDWTGFAADWGPLFRQRGRMEFLSDVFVHEYAHIISLKAFSPWSESATSMEIGGLAEDEEWLNRWGVKPTPAINPDVGASLVIGTHTPFWWAEGGAEYWSDKAGYNVWGDSRDAFLRTTVLEDRLLSQSEWTTRIDKEGFDGERGYNGGYSFGLYLHERFGKHAMTEMATRSGKRWHYSWDKVVEEVTGEDMDDLYADWKKHLEDKYEAQVAPIRKRGVVQGRELSLTEPMWEAKDGELKEQWEKLSKKKQDAAIDYDTAWQELPDYSPDGRYLAWFEHGLVISEVQAEEWGAIGGDYLDPEEDAERIEQIGRRTFVEDWVRGYPVNWAPDSKRLVAVGSEDFTNRTAMNQGLTFNADGYSWNQLLIGTIDDSGKRLKVDWQLVPNTLRAQEAAFSPDGQTLAFSRYSDGTHDIWTIKTDGTDAVRLTEFGDGTQVQGIDWVDEHTLMLGLYREDRQDVWMFSLEDRSWRRLTDSVADETDPVLGPDGHVWFAANVDGFFNVYDLDPDTMIVRKQTDVLGGAYGPEVTADGHLLFTDFTGHGMRIKAMNAEARKDEVVEYEGVCSEDACADAAEAIARRVHVPDVRASSTRYSALKESLPITMYPVLRYTDRNVQVGASLSVSDFVEKHAFDVEAAFGKDNYFAVNYYNNMFWPSISLGYSRYAYKGTYGYGIDQDGLPETDDLLVVDQKFEQVSDDLYASLSYVPSDVTWISLYGDWSRYAFRGIGDGEDWGPYLHTGGVGAYVEWSPRGGGYWGDDWINPRGGRRIYLDYSFRRTHVVDRYSGGAVYDDGEALQDYSFHKAQLSWTEFVPVPGTRRHTLQLDLDAGYISRNVMGWDEFLAGGRHPYNWGNGTIGNNMQFSGYEGWSLAGETMLIGNAAWRFPIARDLNLKTGPVYTDAVYMQFFGTAGNLWSYRVEGPSHTEGGSVVPSEGGSVRREVPFKDFASKNSPVGRENHVLVDVGAEVRVRAFIWNDWDWDCFVRGSYGLQPTSGYGDVNGDMIQSSVARDAASELSAEVEPATLRLYVGLGTGW